MKIEIPFRLPGLNEYIDRCRKNAYAGNQMKRETEQSLLWICKGVKDRPQGPVWITFEWHEPNRRRDMDNVAFAKKFILDAMQKSGILSNDSPRYILGFADRFVYDGTGRVIVEWREQNERCEQRRE